MPTSCAKTCPGLVPVRVVVVTISWLQLWVVPKTCPGVVPVRGGCDHLGRVAPATAPWWDQGGGSTPNQLWRCGHPGLTMNCPQRARKMTTLGRKGAEKTVVTKLIAPPEGSVLNDCTNGRPPYDNGFGARVSNHGFGPRRFPVFSTKCNHHLQLIKVCPPPPLAGIA